MGAATSKVAIARGFTQFLPQRSTIFFQRDYFASYPRPIQQAGLPPFPRSVPIAKIQAPAQQAIVLRSIEFQAFEHSGIGVEDIVQVPRARTLTYLGFTMSIGDRGISDYTTNLPAAGVPIAPIAGPQAGVGLAPRAGQGSIRQGTGLITPDPGQNFAAYAQPGEVMKMDAWVIRPPNFDCRLFQVLLSGWIMNENLLQQVLDEAKG